MGDIKSRFVLEGEQQYKSAMSNAAAALKVLNSEQKLAAAQFKSTGDAEKYASQQSDILKKKIEQQKTAVKAAEQALKQLSDNGVQKNSRQYQQWETRLNNAQTSLVQMETELRVLNSTMEQTTNTASTTENALGKIGKKLSLDQVITGIGSITSGLEKAAKTAINLSTTLWNEVLGAAGKADDTLTLAEVLGLDQETVQKMQKVAPQFEATAEQIGGAWKKLRMNMTSDSDEVVKAFEELKVKTHNGFIHPFFDAFSIKGQARDYIDVFWEVGEALMNITNEADRERLAQKTLGRSWDELKVLFGKGREEYEAALESQSTISEEAMKNLAELNDKYANLIDNWETLKGEALGSLAPALTAGAEALSTLLNSVTEYLKTPEGQELLSRLGDAVSGLFEDLKSIDPEDVVDNFAKLFNGVVDSFKWLEEHWGDVKIALMGIAGGFAVLKITTLALNIGKTISGLNGLLGGGGGTPAPTTGTGGGSGTGISTGEVSAIGGLVAKAGVAAAKLSMYDPSGATALIIPVMEDKTTFGRTLRDGGTLGEAFGNSWETIKASASEGLNNFAKYFTEDLPNAFWQMFGFKGTDDAVNSMSGGTVNVMGMTVRSASSQNDKKNEVDVDTHFVVSDEEDEEILKQLGIINIPARISIVGMTGGGTGFTLDGITQLKHANGIPWIENDNTLALLHRGERVLTASENRHYTYNSNNYFGNVNLNNGQDIEALCDSIDRHNRRQGAGYGS